MQCPKCHQPLADEDDEPYICCAAAPIEWQCQQCGKVSEGFAFPYGRCGQCGGRLALRSPEPAGAADGSLTAVRMAFEIELGGRAFYQRAAADSPDEEMRSLFGRLAVMEGEHMETLSRRYHVEVPEPSTAFRIELAAIFASVENRPQDPANLFLIAMALEKRAADFFAERAGRAPEDSVERRLYQELAAEEREHAALLATEYKRWRAGKPGLLSGDPLVTAVRAAAPEGTPVPQCNAAALLLTGQEDARTALVCGDRQISYGELREQVARAAGVWQAHGIGFGDRVAIRLPDGIDWVVAWLGAIWSGAIAVAINPRIPAADWEYILDEAGFGLIVAESSSDTPAPWKSRVLTLADWRREFRSAAPVAARMVEEDQAAFWTHSSGTSGKPKAVVHAHRALRAIERVGRERLGISANDRVLATSRLFFSYPLANSLITGLKLGATVILDPQWPTAASVAATVAATHPTVLFSVPSLYRNLLQEGLAPALVQAGVRRCVSAGEALPASLRAAWREQTGLGIIDGFGASETLVLVLTGLAGEDGLRPSPGVEVKPLDEAAAGAGAPTRLLFRAPTLALGYLDRPAAQSDSFRGGAFCPADLFIATADGGWRFAGREDSLVKISGRWVNLVELEERFAGAAAELRELAAAAVPDGDGIDSVALFYVAGTGAEAAVERALVERSAGLSPHQRPRWYHPIDALPRTATGKLLRRRLAELRR